MSSRDGSGGAQPLVFTSIRTTAWGPRRQTDREGVMDVGTWLGGLRTGQVTAGEKGKELSSPDAVRQR